MENIELDGDWELQGADQAGTALRLPATVPGCVHLDLLAAERLPDLWYRDNELQHHWVCERDWSWSRNFDLAERQLGYSSVRLHCEGLDTLAQVLVNGVEVLQADNMFRRWAVELRPHLQLGSNRIEVRFTSPLPTMQAGDERFHLHAWNLQHQDFAGKSWLRKMACSFGWDWGPRAPTAGIYRPIRLECRQARIDDVHIGQEHRRDAVDLRLRADISCTGDRRCRWQLWHEGRQVAEIDGADTTVTVPDPQLWWPNGMGGQPLYTVLVELLDADGSVCDRQRRRIGLRTMELQRQADQWGESFQFAVNGRPVFAKGANWIPADSLLPRLRRADFQRLLGDAAAAHMNIIRCWGGGVYEEAAFYETCDELGLLVWQDFMFACSTFPSFDEVWMANVEAEARDNLRRLRHHPCIALWCGNNEIEQGLVDWSREDDWSPTAMSANDYRKLFDELLPRCCAEEAPAAIYWPGSPHTPVGKRSNWNDPASGDSHCWTVWFGNEPFEAQRGWTHRFMSEFGFQSFPEPATCASFTAPEDRNLTSYVMDYHQRSPNGNKKIFGYLLDWFQVPANYHEQLWMTQLTQALCIQFAAEHSRRQQPRMMGCVYWQLNDLWPAATWSSIDVYGRWKALHYFAARFFAPILVSGLEDAKDGSVAIHVSNQLPRAVDVTVRWHVTRCDGSELDRGMAFESVASQHDDRLAVQCCADLRQQVGDRDLLIWLEAEQDAQVVSRNLVTFARPKHLLLQKPTLTTRVEDDQIVIHSDRPALWVRLEVAGQPDLRFADNFFHLQAGEERRIAYHGTVDTDTVRRGLRTTSVVDTWL